MLKITSHNEKLNRRMAQKETNHLLYKIFRCFFISFNKSKRPKPWRYPKIFRKTQNLFLSKRAIFISQCQRYCINWQAKLLFHSSFTKVRTICFLTGRSRSVYRAFRLSRLRIRAYAAAGHFVGLSKASW